MSFWAAKARLFSSPSPYNHPLVQVSDFYYELPESLIAQEALPNRAASRMLHLDKRSGALRDVMFRDLPGLLRPDDLLVMNNTRVFAARLYGRRRGANAQALSPQNPASRDFLKGRIEILLTRQTREDPNEWDCLVRPGRKVGVGEELFFGPHDELHAKVVERGEFGERHIRFARVDNFFELVEKIGHVPLPPYIDREDRPADRERYQTVYAKEKGSIAAPTAGLHFTPEILAQIRERGIEIAEVTLHVGLGTFHPVRVQRVEDHHLHREHSSITPAAAEQIDRAMEQGRRIVAVGTTTARTLEHAGARSGTGRPAAGTREADLFIYPGYSFCVVGALLTNFHLPESTLLMLVCALGGKEHVLNAYRHAVRERYRFYSYGDCMLLE
jgi:S-adenosylmethionine:tRNA ribosyltransferase-isomerase